MKIIKNILIAFGGLFLLLVLLIAFLASSSSGFKDDYEPFAKQFLTDFSVEWERSNVIDRMSNTLIEDSASKEALDMFKSLRGLGKLKDFGEITIENYSTHTDTGEEAIFIVSTFFEAGHALWKISVNVKGNTPKITALHLVSFEGELMKNEEVVKTRL